MELTSYNSCYNELYHHGILGQKWGVRRYQNADGSLTMAGKRRYNQELAKVRAEEKVLKNREATAAKLKKLEDRKQAVEDKKRELDGEKTKKSDDDGTTTESNSTTKKHSSLFTKEKKISEMTDEEIQAKIDRINLEKKYKALLEEQNNTGKNDDKGKNKSNSSDVSKGQKLVEDVVYNSAKNIGTQSVTYLMGIGANALLEKVANDKNAINPKKGQKDK